MNTSAERRAAGQAPARDCARHRLELLVLAGLSATIGGLRLSCAEEIAMSPQAPWPVEQQPVPEGAISFVEQVLRIGGWKGEGPPPTSLPEAGARQLTRIVLAQ